MKTSYQWPYEQTYRQNQVDKQARYLLDQRPKGFTGDTWDAKHLTKFLSRSNYSNWKGQSKNISRFQDEDYHSKGHSSTQGQHFFRTTKDNKNESKIGYTPIFPLVSNAPISPPNQKTLTQFFNTNSFSNRSKDEKMVSGRNFKLLCNPQQRFKFEGNAVKFKETDPLTLKNQYKMNETVNGFQKERMNRLISQRHPHGMTGIDHSEYSQTSLYQPYEQNIRVRQQPNGHQTFLLNRQWKSKKRSVPPLDEWKTRNTITIRKFRNDNVHGYNILTNRQ